MSLLLHIIVTYIKENIITKLQKLYSPPRNPRAGNKSPALFVKKPLCTGDLSPARKIFIERSDIYFHFLMAIGLFVYEVSRSQLLTDVLHSIGFSVSHQDVLKFEKCAAVSRVKFDGAFFVSGSELESVKKDFGNSQLIILIITRTPPLGGQHHSCHEYNFV